MAGWKKIVLMAAGFGGGFALVLVAVAGCWLWYQGRPAKPKPWDAKAIVATFDYPDTKGSNGVMPETIILHYTLENTTDSDYQMPPQEQLVLDGKMKREKSLATGGGLYSVDKEHIFIPAKQRIRFTVTLEYPVMEKFGPDPKVKEEYRKKFKLIADYIKKEFPNLDGFVVFDTTNRYQINLPNGWDNIKLK